MWLIKNINTGECFHLIPEKTKYTIGRAGADLTLRDDTSISRTHAYLHLSGPDKDVLELEDAGSKFGSFHNDGIATNKELVKGVHTEVKNCDRIRFGRLKSIWTASRLSLVSMSSLMSREQAKQLELNLRSLGGRMAQNWEATCTHLTMTEISVSVKVLHALLEQIPIVTCDFWRDMLQVARKGLGALPSSELYSPPISDLILDKDELNLEIRPERNHLFDGLTFVFMNRKHFELYAAVVQKAGGACKDLNSGVQKKFMLKDNVVVVQYVPSTQSQSTQTVLDIEGYLESNSRRIIPEYEIGMAIVHCSTLKYCNPSYKLIGNTMAPNTPSNATSPSSMFIENTNMSNKNPITSEDSDVLVPETEINSGQKNSTSGSSVTQPNIMTATTVSMSPGGSIGVDEVDEMMPNIMITESHKDESQTKRKRKILTVQDDDSDEDLFQFSKKAHQEVQQSIQRRSPRGASKTVQATENNSSPVQASTSKAKATSKSCAKQLPIVVSSKRKSMNTEGFIGKSQKLATRSESNDIPAEPTEARKRPRIAIINDDDDDEDLFNFGGTSAKKSCRPGDANSSNDSQEELFGFKDRAVKEPAVDDDDDELQLTEVFVPKEKSKPKTKPLPTPKQLPQKVSTKGWLTCSFHGMKIKGDKTEKDASAVKSENTETRQWLDSLKVFAVQPLAINISTRSTNKYNSLHNQSEHSNDSTVTLNGTSKNFKAFVKKRDLFPREGINRSETIPVGSQSVIIC